MIYTNELIVASVCVCVWSVQTWQESTTVSKIQSNALDSNILVSINSILIQSKFQGRNFEINKCLYRIKSVEIYILLMQDKTKE